MNDIKWYPYPDNAPPPDHRQRRFLVTLRNPVVLERKDSNINVARWTGRKFYSYDNMVLAWAYLPPPYESRDKANGATM